MNLRAFAVCAAVVTALLVWDVTPARAQSAFPTFYPDISVGVNASMGISHRKRAWHPNTENGSVRTPLSLYLNPGIALLRGIRFEIGLGVHSIEPPVTFSVMPSFKIFPFHKYAFKTPMTRLRGGKWVAPNPINGIYFRPVFMVSFGSIGLKDKDDVDGDATDPSGTSCYSLDSELQAECIANDARNDKARAPIIFGGGLGVGIHLRGEGKAPEAPEIPDAGGMMGGFTDWGDGGGFEPPLDSGAGPPAPPAPEMPDAPEPPKPPAVGFDIEILAMLLRHGGFGAESFPAFRSFSTGELLGPNQPMRYTSAVTTQCIAGVMAGTGNAWVADCEHNVLDFRVELRLSLILFVGP